MPNEPQILTAILGLHAQTSLHPGSGTALGAVDLPIQRERHTHWPTIPGSALKGVLRDACREHVKGRYDDDPDTQTARGLTRRDKANQQDAFIRHAFGPHTEDSSEFAGALSVTDARLLAFPVHSLRGVFAWVTCPAVLDRLRRDLTLGGEPGAVDWKIPQVATQKVSVPADHCPCLIESAHVVLEEFLFQRTDSASAAVAAWIADNIVSDRPAFEGTRARFRQVLLVLNDEDFTHFARYATEVVARVGLDYDTKTVKDGALFYEEFLPPETLLYSVVLASGARARSANGFDAAKILRTFAEALPPVLQIGANQTTGKGYCAVRLSRQGGA